MFNEPIVCDGKLGSHPLEVKITMGAKTLTMAADGLVAWMVNTPGVPDSCSRILTIRRVIGIIGETPCVF